MQEIADPEMSLQLKAIGECLKWPAGNLYLETNTNKTFPPHATATANTLGSAGNATTAAPSQGSATTATGLPSSATSPSFLMPAIGTAFISVLIAVGGSIV